jgi:hypothetical protein
MPIEHLGCSRPSRTALQANAIANPDRSSGNQYDECDKRSKQSHYFKLEDARNELAQGIPGHGQHQHQPNRGGC